MNASKRKFNALLNSFGSKPGTSPSSKSAVNNGTILDFTTNGDADSIAKKRRISRPNSALSSTSSLTGHKIGASTTTSSMANKKTQPIVSTAPALKEAPKYAPWDRVAFLKRLESFKSVTDWTPKPAKVNEVEWAKRGWVCQGWERVRCELCHIEILVKLNVKEVGGEEKRVLNASDIGMLVSVHWASLMLIVS